MRQVSQYWDSFLSGLAKLCLSWPAMSLALLLTLWVVLKLHNIFWILAIVAVFAFFMVGIRKGNPNSRIYITSLVMVLWGGFAAALYLVLNEIMPNWNHFTHGLLSVVIGFVLSYFIGGAFLTRLETVLQKSYRPNLLRNAGIFFVLCALSFGLINIGVHLPKSGLSVQDDINKLGNQVYDLFEPMRRLNAPKLVTPSVTPTSSSFLANTKIAFSSESKEHGIWMMNADGSGQVRLSDGYAYTGSDIVWSPDGTKLVFYSLRTDKIGVTEINVINTDGSGQVRITDGGGEHVAWSPDGTKIAFDRRNDGIYVINADGSGLIRLTDGGDHPTWSPDGTRIAFSSDYQDMNYDIFIMNVDGSGRKRLTNDQSRDYNPYWSPNGSKIAFYSWRTGKEGIYVMNTDGSGQTELFDGTNHGGTPLVWSPDGTQIAFDTSGEKDYGIYVANAYTLQLTRLTNNPDGDWSPSWSPDGAKIAYDSGGAKTGIWVMNADGSKQTRLTDSTGRNPAWSPFIRPNPKQTIPPPAYFSLPFIDDFSSTSSGWSYTTAMESDESDSIRYENGQFSIFLKRSGQLSSLNYRLGPLSDFAMEADVMDISRAAGSKAGVSFRNHTSTGSTYLFYIRNSDRSYWVGKISSGSWSSLVDWTTSSYIKGGSDTNRLKVICRGAQIEVYANDQKLATVTDRSIASGYVGLVVERGDQANAHYHFDNFKVYPVTDASATLPPTPTSPTPTPEPSQTQTPTSTTNVLWFPYIDNKPAKSASHMESKIVTRAMKDNTDIYIDSNYNGVYDSGEPHKLLKAGETATFTNLLDEKAVKLVSSYPVDAYYHYDSQDYGVYDDSNFLYSPSPPGTRFVVPFGKVIAVVAIQDSTKVSIGGDSVILNTGQSYQTAASKGLIISSDKPISAVTISNEKNSHDNSYATELLPASLFGTEFWAPPKIIHQYQNVQNDSQLLYFTYLDGEVETMPLSSSKPTKITRDQPAMVYYLFDIYAKDPWSNAMRHYTHSYPVLPVNSLGTEYILAGAVISTQDNNLLEIDTDYDGKFEKQVTLSAGEEFNPAIRRDSSNGNLSPGVIGHIKSKYPVFVRFVNTGYWSGVDEATWARTVHGQVLPK